MSRKRAGIAYTASSKVFTELVLEVFRFNDRLVFVGDRMTKALGLSTARWQTLGAMALSEQPLTVAEYKVPMVDATGNVSSPATDGNL